VNEPLTLLALTAATVGVLHTLLGPDHYLPFVLMGQAGNWSRTKTVAVTLVCGTGHVLSSVVLGAVGIGLGVAVGRLEAVESFRGQLAAWALIAFGLVYFVWGLRRALRGQAHEHLHAHPDGSVHRHAHVHEEEHLHVHTLARDVPARPMGRLTPWVLFTIFIFGPCEPLIPLLMYPAAQQSPGGVVLVATVFGVATLITMVATVLLFQAGVKRLPLANRLERYAHALAGATLALCGAAIQFLGL